MACTPSTVFAWVGFLLVNIGFVILISWGVATQWVIGFVISCTYSILLFISSDWLRKRFLTKAPESETDIKSSDIKLIIYLLYALSAISLGATGFIISVNIFQCQSTNTNSGSLNNNGWVVNTTLVPGEVQSWIESYKEERYISPTFAYFPGSKVTLFNGDDGKEEDEFPGSSTSKLWQIGHSDKPTSIPDMYNPSLFFSSESTQTICFTAEKWTNIQQVDSSVRFTSERRIVCTDDGITLRDVDKSEINLPRYLHWNNGTLWVVGRSQDTRDWGDLIFSVDPVSMEVTLYSEKITVEPDDPDLCLNEDDDQKIAIASLFLATLPVTVASIFLFVRDGIPTLPIIAYIGISASVIATYFAVDPEFRWDNFFTWWFSMSSTAWLLGKFFLFLTRRIKRETMVWSSSVSSIVFFVSMIILIGVPGSNDDWWRWVIINTGVFLPLIFIGTVCESTIVLITGAIGLFIDVGKIANEISKLNDDQATVPIFFGVFAVSGILLGLLGWQLNKYQVVIRDNFLLFTDRFFMPCLKKTEQTQVVPERLPLVTK